MCREIGRTSALCPHTFPSHIYIHAAVEGVEAGLTPDPNCWRESANKSEIGFAVSLGALAYFWSVGRLKESTMCDLIFVSTLEKEKSVWSVTCGVEHKKDLSLLPQAHIIYWIFPCLYIVETKSNCLGIFSLFHSVGYATYDTIIILLDGLNVPTSLALSMQWSFSIKRLSYSVGTLTACVPSKDIYGVYTCCSVSSL